MTKEELLELKLTEEQIAEIFKINGKDVEKAKGDLGIKDTELKTLQGQLTEANKKINDFKGLDLESIKQAADDYKQKFEDSEAKSKEDIKKLQLNYKIENLLLKEGAVNTKAVKALLDSEKISLDGENIIGFDDQLKAIKESDPWAFSDKGIVKTKLPGGSKPDELSDVEKRFYEKNPDIKPQ